MSMNIKNSYIQHKSLPPHKIHVKSDIHIERLSLSHMQRVVIKMKYHSLKFSSFYSSCWCFINVIHIHRYRTHERHQHQKSDHQRRVCLKQAIKNCIKSVLMAHSLTWRRTYRFAIFLRDDLLHASRLAFNCRLFYNYPAVSVLWPHFSLINASLGTTFKIHHVQNIEKFIHKLLRKVLFELNESDGVN